MLPSLPNPSRALVAMFLVASVALAGCLGGVQDLAAQSADDPGDDPFATEEVEPTGETVEVDLYLRQGTQALYPGMEVPIWGFSTGESGPVSMPGPTIRVTEGDTLKVNFYNTHPLVHTIHWHGLHVPHDMDGVPYISQEPVASGAQFTYTFTAKPTGTFWYHCHVDAPHHIDMGMYGLIIVEPQEQDFDAKEVPHDREVTMVLDEVDKDHVHNFQQFANRADPTHNPSGNPYYTAETGEQQAKDLGNNPPDGSPEDPGPTAEERDWYPQTHPAYDPDYDTWLINGKAFPYTEPITISDGERLKIRLANVGGTPASLHLHGHSFWVTHKDGYKLAHPYRADVVGLFPGERYDLLVVGDNPGLWAFHDHIAGHTSNDDIYPGGALTFLAYDDYLDQVPNEMPDPDDGGFVSGNLIRHYLG